VRLAREWMAQDPDPETRAELAALLDDESPTALEDLASRFTGRLHFGTAGLRGKLGAGPSRMNLAVVRQVSAALAAWLSGHVPGAAEAGVVIGCDARHGSSRFARETALVLTGAGIRVHLLPEQRPTPLLAYAIRYLGAASGVMITASHNPATENGYKLYLGDGAQIVPPVDAEIETLIDSVGPLSEVPLGDLGSPLVARLGVEIEEAFVKALVRHSGQAPRQGQSLRIVYTPLHGVALPVVLRALECAGYPPPNVVAAQARPDPDFPTVAFPNPEEPGTLDLALGLARSIGADVVLANDPDGDRLAVAIPDPAAEGEWRILTGDEVGSLLGAYLLERSASEPDPGSRLVVTTVVSSSLLSKVAAAASVHYAETLTGFKWIVRVGDSIPGSRFLFGYEEALGYSIGTVVRDKDGTGAALAFLGLTAAAREQGRSPLDLLDDLERRHGVHLTSQETLRTEAPAQVMARLRQSSPRQIAGLPVLAAEDLAADVPASLRGATLPRADVLVYHMQGARLVVRPSGTEPKLKAYLEVVVPVVAGDLARARASAIAEMDRLRSAVVEELRSASEELPLR
jgi:phosphomannomutase